MNRKTETFRQIKIFAVFAGLGLAAELNHVHIPYKDALIDGRWTFGFMGFALLCQGWASLVIICYQAFTTPVVWGVTAFREGVPILPRIWQSWQEQPFLIESILTALFSATAMVAVLTHQHLRGQQNRLDHIYRVLLGIRNVNQLIVSEDSSRHLIETACANLTETMGYLNVWIALTDKEGKSIAALSSSGFNGGFEAMSARLKSGKFPDCIKRALDRNEIILIKNPRTDCPDCPLSPEYGARAGFTRRLRFEGRTYGFLAVSVPAAYARDSEEQALFKEIANDLAFALHKIETAGHLEESRRLSRRLFEKLQTSYAMLARTEQIARVGSWEWDIDNDHVKWSDQLFHMFQLNPEHSAPSFAEQSKLYVPEDMQRLQQAVEQCRINGTPYELELRAVGRDGRRFQCIARGQAQTDEKGRIHGLAGSLQDITERKNLENQLRRSQKMEAVGRLAGGVAHDFNNMLGVIFGRTELAMGKTYPEAQIYEDLQEIFTAARRSADITRQLLAFARKQTIASKVIDLNKIIEGVLKMLGRIIGEDIELLWKPAENLWAIKMDPSQIDQILANLCVNAKDAISGVGKITFETDQKHFDEAYCSAHTGFIPGDFILLTVSDNGCGMGKDTLSNLFEPFYTTKEMGKGTGLGLATVYGIVKQNSGFINVYSEPGQGTSFKIYLPRAHCEPEAQEMNLSEEPAPHGSETILLVEDEPAILKMIQVTLERLGYTVLSAGTPLEALALAGDIDTMVHLLITDVVMPEMNGRDLAGKLASAYPASNSCLCRDIPPMSSPIRVCWMKAWRLSRNLFP